VRSTSSSSPLKTIQRASGDQAREDIVELKAGMLVKAGFGERYGSSVGVVGDGDSVGSNVRTTAVIEGAGDRISFTV